MLNFLELKNFNVCLEVFYLPSSDSKNGIQKNIFYLQINFSNCIFRTLNSKELDLFQLNILNEECRVSYIITKELIRLYCTSISQIVVNDTIEESLDQETETSRYKVDLDDKSNFHYLIKIINLGPLHSLANTQLKTKLRADIQIQMVPIVSNQSPQPIFLILSLMSKFLFYYNFLYVGGLYLLKSSTKLDCSNKEKIVFIDDNMRIIDDFMVPNIFINKLKNNESKLLNQQEDFLTCLTGVLIDKRLKSNNNPIECKLNDSLENHFDLMVPNKQFKLILKLDRSENEENDEYFTVYFDTRFSIYQLSILPGMKIQVFNLIKKADRVYRCNSSISVLVNQDFNFFQIDESTKMIQQAEKKSLHQNLLDLNNIFTSFYQFEEKSANVIKNSNFSLNLLFKNSISEEQDKSTGYVKLFAQITKIYELNLRLKCKICNLLASSCACQRTSKDMNDFKLEFSFLVLVDDHTSILKLSFLNSDHNLKNNQSNFFTSISNFLNTILFKYLNEIKMPNIPIQQLNDENQPNYLDQKSRVYKAIKEKLLTEPRNENNLTIDNSILKSALNSNDASYVFENYVKTDIYKTIYDYLVYTVLDKHFLFYIDLNDLSNLKEMQKISFKSLKPKINYKYFKFSEMYSNEQFKSILQLKCSKFLPAYMEFDEN